MQFIASPQIVQNWLAEGPLINKLPPKKYSIQPFDAMQISFQKPPISQPKPTGHVTKQKVLQKFVQEYHPHNKQYNLSDFQQLKMLGKGSFGEVYAAKYLPTGVTFVIKRIAKSKMDKNLFMSELDTLIYVQKYCGKYFLCYDGHFEDANNWYVVTEYLENYVPLSKYPSYLKTKNDKEKYILLVIITKIIKGLQALHKLDVVHADIKPDNILVENKWPFNIKYIDFGLSCFKTSCNKNRWHAGTLPYMSPELVLSDKSFTLQDMKKIDIWALGITIYQMIAGTLPYFVWLKNVKKEFPPRITQKMIETSEAVIFYLRDFDYLKNKYTLEADTYVQKVIKSHAPEFIKFVRRPLSLRKMLEKDPNKRQLGFS